MNRLHRNTLQRVERFALIPVAIMAVQTLPLLLLWPVPERWSEALAPVITLYWVANFPLAQLLSHPLAYFLLLVAASGLLLLTFLRAKQRRVRLAVLSALAIVLLYALAPWYQYPLEGNGGYRLEAVTAPYWWQGGLRFNQVMAERVPCHYQLAGWDAEERLYYTATCQGKESAWRYAPHRGRREQVQAIPPTLTTKPAVQDAVLDHVRAGGVRPAREEPSVRRILLRDAGFISPDGRYTALVVNHLYSVQDVMLLEKEN